LRTSFLPGGCAHNCCYLFPPYSTGFWLMLPVVVSVFLSFNL
jgi:hypothetical protein